MALTDFVDGKTPVPASWLNAVFGNNGHVHDGQDEDGHAPKISFKDHIDWGDYGVMEVITDTFDSGAGFARHVIEYRSTDSNADSYAWFKADYLSALLGTIEVGDNGQLKANTDDSSLFELLVDHLSGGSDAQLTADILKATTKLVADALEPASGDWLSIEDVANSTLKGLILAKLQHESGGYLDIFEEGQDFNQPPQGGIRLEELRQTSSQNVIYVLDSNDNVGDGRFNSRSDPKGLAKFTVGSSSLSLAGNVNYGLTGNYQNPGDYDIGIPSADQASDVRVEVQTMGTTVAIPRVEVGSTSQVSVFFEDTSGSSVDPDAFTIAVYH